MHAFLLTLSVWQPPSTAIGQSTAVLCLIHKQTCFSVSSPWIMHSTLCMPFTLSLDSVRMTTSFHWCRSVNDCCVSDSQTNMLILESCIALYEPCIMHRTALDSNLTLLLAECQSTAVLCLINKQPSCYVHFDKATAKQLEHKWNIQTWIGMKLLFKSCI